MAQRLYNIGLSYQVHWSKKGENDTQTIGYRNQSLEEQFQVRRHSSSPAIVLSRQSIFRNGNISSPGLTLHIQSMKKSAFKMLCKFSKYTEIPYY
jgi:hypothetical protein